ncbi:hypothetical protein QFC21_005547 [Naganishia friedmannii]|uniref:Uncharacterized protein n=1 Tax=Naganishia friedmannii TaxID=89922 RepID=A0ACC2V976_9TREE|nr:hypothetical protein QFC21_005547 [Naganishia friedmannii]
MPSTGNSQAFQSSLAQITEHINHRFTALNNDHPTPTRSEIDSALQALPLEIPSVGLGIEGTVNHLLEDVTQGLLKGHAGSRFFGLVTGGVTPASQLADILGTSLETFQGRSVTTGATASNIMGLACARDALLLNSKHLPKGYTIAEHGFPPPIHSPTSPTSFLPPIKVITVKPHGSIMKAAAVTGIGRMNVLDLPASALPSTEVTVGPVEDDPWGLKFDLEALENQLKDAKQCGQGVIVVVTLGEVNTGGFTPDIPVVADLCKTFGAWLHIDAAHKWLNVPYDTAMFYTRTLADLKRTFGPSPRLGTPAYLQVHASSSATTQDDDMLNDDVLKLRAWHAGLPSSLDCGIENSRRFRALPLYAGLMEQGRDGYTDIVKRNCEFAQRIARWMTDSEAGGQWYTLINALPAASNPSTTPTTTTVPLNIVLFRGSETSPFPSTDKSSATRLLHAINEQRLIFVTATSWGGVGALRIAVSNWRTGDEGEGDWEAVVKALTNAMKPEGV